MLAGDDDGEQWNVGWLMIIMVNGWNNITLGYLTDIGTPQKEIFMFPKFTN